VALYGESLTVWTGAMVEDQTVGSATAEPAAASVGAATASVASSW
jgi:hypothetical protein